MRGAKEPHETPRALATAAVVDVVVEDYRRASAACSAGCGGLLGLFGLADQFEELAAFAWGVLAGGWAGQRQHRIEGGARGVW